MRGACPVSDDEFEQFGDRRRTRCRWFRKLRRTAKPSPTPRSEGRTWQAVQFEAKAAFAPAIYPPAKALPHAKSVGAWF